MKEYFISFSHVEFPHTLFGNAFFKTKGTIIGKRDIVEIERRITEDKGLKKVVVINWKEVGK